MRRRKFITLVGAAALGSPLAAWCSAAQSAEKMWRIGFLSSRFGSSELSRSFFQGLQELGYVEGQNIVVEYRAAAGKNERLPELAADLVHTGVDLIATEGTPATRAAMQATKTIPIVFGSAQDPVEKGIVASLARPGGNVTGMALIADHAKPLELLKQAVPGLSRVAFIYDPATRPGAYGEATLSALHESAHSLGIALQAVVLRDPDDTDHVFATLAAATNGLLIENSAINLIAEQRICELATQRGIPAVGSFRECAAHGCLMSYGENLPDVYRRAAGYVDKILKGAMPSDLPVMQATTFDLVINLKAAHALGLSIPVSLLALAADTIE
jgi:putative tryptophan/tyrosine transport system substrate-binding protein